MFNVDDEIVCVSPEVINGLEVGTTHTVLEVDDRGWVKIDMGRFGFPVIDFAKFVLSS